MTRRDIEAEAERAAARFLAEMRDRVAWQAEAADRLRRGLSPQPYLRVVEGEDSAAADERGDALT